MTHMTIFVSTFCVLAIFYYQKITFHTQARSHLDALSVTIYMTMVIIGNIPIHIKKIYHASWLVIVDYTTKKYPICHGYSSSIIISSMEKIQKKRRYMVVMSMKMVIYTMVMVVFVKKWYSAHCAFIMDDEYYQKIYTYRAESILTYRHAYKKFTTLFAKIILIFFDKAILSLHEQERLHSSRDHDGVFVDGIAGSNGFVLYTRQSYPTKKSRKIGKRYISHYCWSEK